jgi:hypothetical protein
LQLSDITPILTDIISQSANSPQYLAFLWLVYIDDVILCPPPSQDGGASTFDGTDVDASRWLAKDNSSRAFSADSWLDYFSWRVWR